MSSSISDVAARGIARRSHNLPRALLLVGSLAIVSAGGFWIGYQRVSVQSHDGPLRIDPRYLDFGRVPVDDRFPWKLTIANTSRGDIDIIGIQTSCGCAEINPKSLVIPAQDSADVHLALNLATRDAEKAMTHEWPFATQVTVTVKDPRSITQNYVWVIHGDVWSPVVASPQELVFPEGTIVRGVRSESATADLVSESVLEKLTASCDSQYATAIVTRAQDDARRYQLTVTLSQGLSAGNHDFPVTLHGKTNSGMALPPTIVRVSAMVVEDVELVPPEIRFHPAQVGELLQESIVLQSRTAREFRLLSVIGEIEGLQAEQRDDGQVIRMRQRVVRTGLQKGTLRIVISQDELDSSYEVECRVSYFGIAE